MPEKHQYWIRGGNIAENNVVGLSESLSLRFLVVTR